MFADKMIFMWGICILVNEMTSSMHCSTLQNWKESADVTRQGRTTIEPGEGVPWCYRKRALHDWEFLKTRLRKCITRNKYLLLVHLYFYFSFYNSTFLQKHYLTHWTLLKLLPPSHALPAPYRPVVLLEFNRNFIQFYNPSKNYFDGNRWQILVNVMT